MPKILWVERCGLPSCGLKTLTSLGSWKFLDERGKVGRISFTSILQIRNGILIVIFRGCRSLAGTLFTFCAFLLVG